MHIKTTKTIIRLCAVTVLIPVGLAGILLPIMPGLVFLALGLYLLTIDFPWIEKRIVSLRKKYPKLNHAMRRFDG